MATYNPVARASFTSAAYPNQQPLLADGHDVTSRAGTVASGIGVLKRGQICKIVPATGVITVGATAAEANCVLAEDVDATAATVGALVYLTGRMKADAIAWPGALNHADVSEALRSVGIYIESVVTFAGTTAKSAPNTEEAAEAKRRLDLAREEVKKKAEEPENPDAPPPSDSPSAYMTAEEREKHPELGALAQTLAAQEDDDDKHEKKPAVKPQPSVTTTTQKK